MLLTGTFPRAIDDKHRIAIPKRIRDALRLAESAVLYIVLGQEKSLAIYTEDALATLAGDRKSVSPAGEDVRAFNRLFYASAEPAEVDSQGRIRIPPSLADDAKLGKDVVLLGVYDHLELWNRERWEEYAARQSAQFDQLAERAFIKGVDAK